MRSKSNLAWSLVLFILVNAPLSNTVVFGQSNPCDVVSITKVSDPFPAYSADSSLYFVNVQDSVGVFQIYVGNAGSPTLTNISSDYSNGNCFGR